MLEQRAADLQREQRVALRHLDNTSQQRPRDRQPKTIQQHPAQRAECQCTHLDSQRDPCPSARSSSVTRVGRRASRNPTLASLRRRAANASTSAEERSTHCKSSIAITSGVRAATARTAATNPNSTAPACAEPSIGSARSSAASSARRWGLAAPRTRQIQCVRTDRSIPRTEAAPRSRSAGPPIPPRRGSAPQ